MFVELADYFFSKKFGWVQDQFGISWQLICHDNRFADGNLPG
ncbi:VOC family protein [Sporolactobacillus pectinivorans]